MTEEYLEKLNELERRINHLERLEHNMANNHGYIGGAWQKDPIRLGFSAQRLINQVNTNLGDGTNNLDSASAAAGEIWVITNVAVRYLGTVAGVVLKPGLFDGTNNYYFNYHASITSGYWYTTQGEWILKEDDVIRLAIEGATATDDAYLRGSGFRVDIDL